MVRTCKVEVLKCTHSLRAIFAAPSREGTGDKCGRSPSADSHALVHGFCGATTSVHRHLTYTQAHDGHAPAGADSLNHVNSSLFHMLSKGHLADGR